MHQTIEYRSPRTEFGPREKGYVAGAGRGAVGFTTRSDIGPARQAVVPIDRSISAQKERARQVLLRRQLGIQGSLSTGSNNGPMLPATPGALISGMPIKEDKDEDLSESNYDPFSGYASSLFNAGNYDDEDLEADNIFHAIDQRMDLKRKRRREKREREQWAEYHSKRPRVEEFFRKEKRQLANLNNIDWENIPDAADLTKRRPSSSRSEKYTPVPDSIIEGARHVHTTMASVDEVEKMYGGFETRLPLSGTQTAIGGAVTGSQSQSLTDLTQLGRARDRHLGIQLDKMADNVEGQTVVDPKGYLTDLTSFHITSDTDVSDIRKARQLLSSVISSNPKHSPGWIAAARLEECAGKIHSARNLILRGTDACPHSQDIWLEAARLHDRTEAKSILARAVRQIPKSVKLWMKAAQMEEDVRCKKAVLRRALEIIPNSVALWKAAVELESSNDARIMLSRAVECVPDSVVLWLALARLESYENAKKVLNSARKHCPTDPAIFIAAAKLEEKHGQYAIVDNIIKKALKALEYHKVVIDREQWMAEAAKCENSGYPKTCQAIVNAVIGIDVDMEDRKDRYLTDARDWLKKGQIEVTRAIYAHMLQQFQDRWRLWWDAAMLEKKHGSSDACIEILTKAVKQCTKAVKLWLLLAKEVWRTQKNITKAREILAEAFEHNATNEALWLAAVKMESESGQYDEARKILASARSKCNTPKVWMKSAMLERQLRNTKEEKAILDEALVLFGAQPSKESGKLWMMRAQVSERLEEWNEARSICQKGIKYLPHCVQLWLEYARIEGAQNRISKARSVLETARLKNPNSEELWLAAAELELHPDASTNSADRKLEIAKSLIAKGLQQCPNSGRLLACGIRIEPMATKKSKCVLAIKALKNDVHVFTEVAQFFWQCRKIKQAKDWFERAVAAGPDWGDAWAQYLKFMQQYGTQQQQKEIIERCVSANPRHGQKWTKVSKQIGQESLSTEDILHAVAKL